MDIYDLGSYDYELPAPLIAQNPVIPRDSSRLLVWSVKEDTREHRSFRDILDYLEEGDLLVLNDTRVCRRAFTAAKSEAAEK